MVIQNNQYLHAWYIQLLEFPPDIIDQILRHQTFSNGTISQEGRRVSKLWFFYNVIEIVVWDNVLCKIIYGRVGVFLFSKFGASDKGQVIIFYFRQFAESWNEFVLTIKTKRVFWFWVSVKSVIVDTTKSGKNMVQFLMNFRRHFFRDYFLCVDDCSENDSL